MKPFKLTLILKEDASPHLYINKINELIKKDKTLSPMLKRSLQMMRKTRMPYVLLANKKEIIYNCDEHYHLDRGLLPQITGWSKIDWTEEEIEDYLENPAKYVKESLKLFNTLGYEIFNNTDIPKEEIEKIISLIKIKGKKK